MRTAEPPLSELVQNWVHGWTASRGTPAPVPFAGGCRVDVDRPGEFVRYVLFDADYLPGLPDKVAEPGALIKVPALRDEVKDLFPAPWELRDQPEFFMTARLRPATPALPDGYTLRSHVDGRVAVVQILSPSGETAATGRMGLWERSGIADQIVTEPGHRRRGLGSAVMTALGDAAFAGGARTGILNATADGRDLYTALGWRLRTIMTAAYVH